MYVFACVRYSCGGGRGGLSSASVTPECSKATVLDPAWILWLAPSRDLHSLADYGIVYYETRVSLAIRWRGCMHTANMGADVGSADLSR